MIERKDYLENLKSFREKQIIKVVTGIRRCGKSTLFELYQQYLISEGVDELQIISINFEDADYAEIQDYKQLYKLVSDKLIPNKMNYIFLDEVQNVDGFQKAVDSLFIKKNCDVYITGSNAYLLSGELATLLSGRYIEIKMLPLSFSEFVGAYPKSSNPERMYIDYITKSSFPYALQITKQKDIKQYLEGIYNSVIIKDIYTRTKFSNVEMFQSVIRVMLDNIGNLVSTKKIADTMTSLGRKISVHTVESYLSALCNSFILHKVSRYDIKGKQYLQTGDKYYVCDIGLRYFLLGANKTDDGHILENVIYLELLRRGYEVYIGKADNMEVDFVAINEMGTEYYQVAYTVRDEKTLSRELASLNKINDHNSKYLITMDIQPLISHNGIKQINALDWLLDK